MVGSSLFEKKRCENQFLPLQENARIAVNVLWTHPHQSRRGKVRPLYKTSLSRAIGMLGNPDFADTEHCAEPK